MDAEYHRADSQDGDRIDDPSEDALFMMLGDLDDAENTFLRVRPARGEGWSVRVRVLAPGTYEVDRQDTVRAEHSVTTSTSIHEIAHDLTGWLAGRDRPA
ncbi:hypothetical protein [Streptomyces sp. NPDC049906]|uniref:hypothetical protein n=1 Tax=Streptomyces sp. NPDC049906 TaxID=3155656 RepID=UPI0034278644